MVPETKDFSSAMAASIVSYLAAGDQNAFSRTKSYLHLWSPFTISLSRTSADWKVVGGIPLFTKSRMWIRRPSPAELSFPWAYGLLAPFLSTPIGHRAFTFFSYEWLRSLNQRTTKKEPLITVTSNEVKCCVRTWKWYTLTIHIGNR